MTRQEEKRRLRRTVRELEARLSPRYLEESGRAIAAHLLAMPEYLAAGTVFCFVGFGPEVDTRPILENILAAGKVLCVPRCTGPGQMELRQITDLARLSPGPSASWSPPRTAFPLRRTRWILPFCPASPATMPGAAWAMAADTTTAF